MTTKMLLDCDTGVDDTMAIMYAALHPDIDLLGMTTVWGNVDVPLATRNTLRVLDLVGRNDVPVAQGAAGPLTGGHADFAYAVHGRDGQGNAGDDVPVRAAESKTAVQHIIDTVRAHPGEVWLVPVGPLTNIAAALAVDPELPSLVAGVSLMGGATMAPGNVSAVAEANIWHDAEAAAAVFRAPWPIIMAGLDVTMRIVITPEHREQLAAGGDAGRYMARILQHYGEFYRDNAFGTWSCAMHDTIAVAAAAGTLDVRLAPVVNVEVDSTGGPGHGQTIADLRDMYRGYPPQEGAHCTVLLDVDDVIADEVVALLAAAK
ncbi:purine nucleosidase [Leucobacter luti]|uniref:Purine nucleosidase n=1 Tax=Leucobacter luti TaxID=340320 RepID=A0A4R6RYI1_9MICO|nr:nucleoside hydrolase [Leucobacter luti]MCW2288145.1 purine nucleosidase [Leucobacter luti]TCK45693.1 purine nucleosidase [Leucobacter luti]TDP91405.1 purine nucleosidase [Leucobacter luti]